ncbi:hypothetical protein J2797_005145 [Paraburkholderia terricola]|uniref:hypothetical protein n=1 Tax=Paraburkholderia terricola TaxID=169427 RepID=UPI00286376A2|nr:hypothetical protein [Paraburkholderia terricola]MDR6495229.1 hypothetical protein [Paraburkholderia terricola]
MTGNVDTWLNPDAADFATHTRYLMAAIARIMSTAGSVTADREPDSCLHESVNNPLNLDLQARAELLAYLVSSHLLAKQLTGRWLAPHHVVESTTIWLNSNGAGADVVQRVMLSTRALEVAQELATASSPVFAPEMIDTLFRENLRLDFRSAAARDIYQHCLTRLAGMRWS